MKVYAYGFAFTLLLLQCVFSVLFASSTNSNDHFRGKWLQFHNTEFPFALWRKKMYFHSDSGWYHCGTKHRVCHSAVKNSSILWQCCNILLYYHQHSRQWWWVKTYKNNAHNVCRGRFWELMQIKQSDAREFDVQIQILSSEPSKKSNKCSNYKLDTKLHC